MGRKNNIKQYHSVVAGDMSAASIISAVTDLQFLDNIGIQINWTGSPAGEFQVQISADHSEDFNGNIQRAGNWVPLTLTYLSSGSFLSGTSIPTTVGSPIYLDLNQLSSPYIRVVFNSTLLNASDITAVADVSSSLNDTYFLIDGADGDNWCVWYNVDSAGTDPALPGRTGIEVDIAADDTAPDVATATRTALASCTSVTTIGGATSHITFTQSVEGPSDVADGDVPTGFNFANTSNTGVLDCWLTAKEI